MNNFTPQNVLCFADKHAGQGMHVDAKKPSYKTLSGIIKHLSCRGWLKVKSCPLGTADKYANITKSGRSVMQMHQSTSGLFKGDQLESIVREAFTGFCELSLKSTCVSFTEIIRAAINGDIKAVTGCPELDGLIYRFMDNHDMVHHVSKTRKKPTKNLMAFIELATEHLDELKL